MSPSPSISVAICTFNRAQSLARTLRSLSEALPPSRPWELLIIDNNSTDNTRHVASSWSERLPLRYVFEAEQGLSAARNRATREFVGGLLVFTDDDVLFAREWLTSYEGAWTAHPEAEYFGGCIIPEWEDGKPAWVRDQRLDLLDGLMGWYDLGGDTRAYQPGEPSPFGANFALTHQAIAKHGSFRTDLGVKGGVAGRGEETEYFSRVRAGGGMGVYVGAACLRHLIHSSRFVPRALLRYGVQSGLAAARTGVAECRPGTLRRQMSFAARGLWQLLKGRGDRARQCLINIGVERGLAQAARERGGG